MIKKASLFFLANLLFAILVTTMYAFGYTYDRDNKLYGEWMNFSDLSLNVYGQRWARTAKGLLLVGGAIDVGILGIWYIRRRKPEESILGLEERS